ncbi:hypothetical protein MHBO_003610 [Bonamia ostreae]|uniref:LRRNT domain-containing protein n=1 Tax=Bonamia ostreae TaxID=126728 RepID=A0ABV2AQZ3_9EUKA
MQLVGWVLVVLSLFYSQITYACPDQCSCGKDYFSDETFVYCGSRGLTEVPTRIPTDIYEL